MAESLHQVELCLPAGGDKNPTEPDCPLTPGESDVQLK